MIICPLHQEKGEFIVWDESNFSKVEQFYDFPVLYNDKGFLLYEREGIYKRKTAVFVWAFVIFEEHQNKGYGKIFLEELIKIANGKQIIVDTYTPSLIHLTNKYGLTLFSIDGKN